MSYIVVTARTQDLRKARRALRRKGYTAYIPALSGYRLSAKGGRLRRRRQITLLMSYILVEAPDERIQNPWLHDVLSTDKVQGYLKSGEEAALVPNHIVRALADTVRNGRLLAAANAAKRRLRKGDLAMAKAGAFTSHAGTILQIKKRVAQWETYLFGRPTVVTIAEKDLEKIEEKAA